MRNRVISVMIIVACVFLAVSCNKKDNDFSSAAPEKQGSGEVSPDTVVVSVNGQNIVQQEVDKELQNILMQYQGRIPPQQLVQMQAQFKEQAVESLINKRILFTEADRQNIQVEEKEVVSELKRISAQFETPEKFKEQLKMMGVTEEKLKGDIKQNYRIEKLLKEKLPAVAITDEEVNRFYKENPESFTTPEKITASHILFSLADNATDETKKQKRQKLGSVLKQIRGGADFAELALKNSDCPSKEQGGNLGSFPRGSMVKAFEDVAFKLKKGEVSNIVETPFGLHIIKLTDRTEAQIAPLDQVRDRIKSYLETQKQNTEVGTYLKKLRKEAKVEYMESTKKN